MRLSTKGQYAVRAMVVLAMHGGAGPVSLRFIAEREDISEQYLEQIFIGLKKAQLVKGVRGASGGYTLAKPSQLMTSGDIVRAVEGPIKIVDCEHNGTCERVQSCVTRELWERVSAAMSQVLDATTLADLVLRAGEKIN
ncbi:MAG: Rrf2 family transcriptional regulator [Peptococcaceae bacterium]|nr:Rrf2 family transcriptional regulator [Peptococcaceae bacterium]